MEERSRGVISEKGLVHVTWEVHVECIKNVLTDTLNLTGTPTLKYLIDYEMNRRLDVTKLS